MKTCVNVSVEESDFYHITYICDYFWNSTTISSKYFHNKLILTLQLKMYAPNVSSKYLADTYI